MNENDIMMKAIEFGFNGVGFMDVADLMIVPQYRQFCEMNLCNCYDLVPACPPKCGTVEDMTNRIHQYRRVLVLQTEHDTDFSNDPEGAKKAKQAHNAMADRFISQVWNADEDILRMTAGPWKSNSCMSAYCVDVQKMADHVGLICWADDGKCRFFSQILVK